MTASVSESVGGEVAPYAPYDGGSTYSEYGGSGGRRRGKRNSRRRSKKYMRKMYRGGADGDGDGTGGIAQTGQQTGQQAGQQAGQQTPPNIEENQGGGRRRRGKTQKGKTRKGKTRKGKVSKWITHVKNFSRANKMDFRDALKDPKCKATYHKMK